MIERLSRQSLSAALRHAQDFDRMGWEAAKPRGAIRVPTSIPAVALSWTDIVPLPDANAAPWWAWTNCVYRFWKSGGASPVYIGSATGNNPVSDRVSKHKAGGRAVFDLRKAGVLSPRPKTQEQMIHYILGGGNERFIATTWDEQIKKFFLQVCTYTFGTSPDRNAALTVSVEKALHGLTKSHSTTARHHRFEEDFYDASPG